MRLGLKNLYQHSYDLEPDKLPGTHMTRTKHLDHMVGLRSIVESMVLVKLVHYEDILPSDYYSFIIKFNAKRLLCTKLSQHIGSKKIVKQVNWAKVMKKVEDKVVIERFEENIDEL